MFTLGDAIASLPEPLQNLIGGATVVGEALGAALSLGGQAGLAINGIEILITKAGGLSGILDSIKGIGSIVLSFAETGLDLIKGGINFILDNKTIKSIINFVQEGFSEIMTKINSLPKTHQVLILFAIGITAAALGALIGGFIGEALEAAIPGIGAAVIGILRRIPVVREFLAILASAAAIFQGLFRGESPMEILRRLEEVRIAFNAFGTGSMGPRFGTATIESAFPKGTLLNPYQNFPVQTRDFIITKSGQVIKTDPQDTIMGFRGSSPGNAVSFNPTININASISSEVDINRLAKRLVDIQHSELARKIGGI